MQELNKEAISAALDAVMSKNVEYIPLHEEYMLSMQSAGAYEPVPGYTPKPGELVTPDVIIQMISTGEATKTGITNAVNAGKIRKITAVKSPALIAVEAELTARIEEYHRVCNAAVALISVKKTGARKASGTTSPGEVGVGKQADVTGAIHAMDAGAVVSFNGRRVFGTLSNGASFDYDVYGQSYLTSISKMLTPQ